MAASTPPPRVRRRPVLQPVTSPPTPLRARGSSMEEDPERKQVAERVLETAAELERLIKGRSDDELDESSPDSLRASAGGRPSGGRRRLLRRAGRARRHTGEDLAEVAGALYLVTESGETEQIVKDRYVIGRGKHCDFVINSGKVSREHAVITREGDDFFIEDLGSSNGTWFNKQRIKRRQIEDGDEYFICSEKVQLVLR